MEFGLFNDLDYFLILKTDENQERKKRVNKSIYEQVEIEDLVFKGRFSLSYSVNEHEKSISGIFKILIQAGLFYALISLFLLFLDFSRR